MCHAITCISACTNARCDWLFNASSHGISLQHSTESRDAYGVDDPAMLVVSLLKRFLTRNIVQSFVSVARNVCTRVSSAYITQMKEYCKV